MPEKSPEPDSRSITDQFLLVALTPSILARLGLSSSDLADIGTATLRLTNSQSESEARLFTITSVLNDLEDPNREMLKAQPLARRMKRTNTTVRSREIKGTLFSVSLPEFSYVKRYPVFQIYPNVDIELLTSLIGLFRANGATTTLLWDFLRKAHPRLGNLTGVEFLIERIPKRSDLDLVLIAELMALGDEQRRQYVIDLASKSIEKAA